jgi:hypothetical protein
MILGAQARIAPNAPAIRASLLWPSRLKSLHRSDVPYRDSSKPPARLGSNKRRWRDSVSVAGSPNGETCLATATGILCLPSGSYAALTAPPPPFTARMPHRSAAFGDLPEATVRLGYGCSCEAAPSLAPASHGRDGSGLPEGVMSRLCKGPVDLCRRRTPVARKRAGYGAGRRNSSLSDNDLPPTRSPSHQPLVMISLRCADEGRYAE